MGCITVGAFATLGEGNSKDKSSKKLTLSGKKPNIPGTFSLRSGYTFRGNQVIDLKENKYINLNTVITYQQGNTTYTIPLKKKVILSKVTFNPNAVTR
jgi:hypothetical protein